MSPIFRREAGGFCTILTSVIVKSRSLVEAIVGGFLK